jgi:hypothetical protein
MMTVYSNNTVSIDGQIVGRIDSDSFQMLTGVRGKTTFFTGTPGTYDQPHAIDVPLYVPATSGSVSSWKINPEFEAAARAIVA